MVLYETHLKGKKYQLGTSGFLYRSNKLMYDRETSSMWSTLHGTPVVGPLVGKGIELKRRSVVTTTWGEWRTRHPETTVLSLKTGYRRDYGEGVAYQRYFSTDELMFTVPKADKRLPNKREVLAFRADDGSHAVAIDTEFLKKRPIYQLTVNNDKLVVFTSAVGAARAYNTGTTVFKKWDQKEILVDQDKGIWKMTESALIKEGSGTILKRYPSHQSFWFGWHAQFPKSRLIQ